MVCILYARVFVRSLFEKKNFLFLFLKKGRHAQYSTVQYSTVITVQKNMHRNNRRLYCHVGYISVN
jgi:hypothetical protein